MGMKIPLWTPEYWIFIIPIIVGFATQTVKFVAYTLKHGWNPSYALTHGHMPSAHTAFVVSLVTSVGFFDGMGSGAFAVAMAFAVIVIDDAARLRVYMGDQGRYLNMLIRQLNVEDSNMPRLKERVGHKISEVIIGGIIGFAATLVLANWLA